MIYSYCQNRDIFTKNTGKILVSSDKNCLKKFKLYKSNAVAAGGTELKILSEKEIKKIEPEINADFGLLSPETGIVDVHALINSLENDFVNSGGIVSLNSKFLECYKESEKFISKIKTSNEEFHVTSKKIIFATGLHSKITAAKTPIHGCDEIREFFG